MTKGGGLFPSQAKPRKEGRKARVKVGSKEKRRKEGRTRGTVFGV